MTLAERLARIAREAMLEIVGDAAENVSDEMLPVVFSATYQPVHDAVRRAASAERHAWHARFVECNAHPEWCPFLAVAQQTRCTCGAHMKLAEMLAELAKAARAGDA